MEGHLETAFICQSCDCGDDVRCLDHDESGGVQRDRFSDDRFCGDYGNTHLCDKYVCGVCRHLDFSDLSVLHLHLRGSGLSVTYPAGGYAPYYSGQGVGQRFVAAD